MYKCPFKLQWKSNYRPYVCMAFTSTIKGGLWDSYNSGMTCKNLDAEIKLLSTCCSKRIFFTQPHNEKFSAQFESWLLSSPESYVYVIEYMN